MRTLSTLVLVLLATTGKPQDTTFYRVVTTGESVITHLSVDGMLTVSNAVPTGSVLRVDRCRYLSDPTWYSLVFECVNSRVSEIHLPGPLGRGFWSATRVVPGGTFQMGETYSCDEAGFEGRCDEWLVQRPVHTVRVDAFRIDMYEVYGSFWNTVYEWATNHGYSFENSGVAFAPTHPVVMVNWYDCVKWCNARSQMDGYEPVYYTDASHSQLYTNGAINISNEWVKWDADGFRLPTEAEWEKAARGTLVGHHFPWPSTGGVFRAHLNGTRANYSGSGDPFDTNEVATTPVSYYNGHQIPHGEDTANGYGIYDMAGNVYEWCWDWADPNYYSNSPPDNPKGPPVPPNPAAPARIIRGSAWTDSWYGGDDLRCAVRNVHEPWNATSTDKGFRCVQRFNGFSRGVGGEGD